MARIAQDTCDYFSHHTGGSRKTLTILDSRFGNDGYVAWFKLLETLTVTDGHCYHADTDMEISYLAACWRVDEEKAVKILNLLANLDAIDRELWEKARWIWCQKLVNGFTGVYKKRGRPLPEKPILRREYAQTNDTCSGNTPKSTIPGTEKQQSKVKESRVNKDDNPACAREGFEPVSVTEIPQDIPDDDLPPDMRDQDAALTYATFVQEHGEYNITPEGARELYSFADRLGHDLTRHVVRKAGTLGNGPAQKSWAYVAKILLRTETQGVKTIAEYDAREAARIATKQGTGPPAPKRKKVWIEKLGGEFEIGEDGRPIMTGG